MEKFNQKKNVVTLGQKNCGIFGQKWNVLAYLQTTEVKCSLWRQLEIQRIGDEYILQVLRHTWDSYLLKCIECLILKIWVCTNVFILLTSMLDLPPSEVTPTLKVKMSSNDFLMFMLVRRYFKWPDNKST